MLVLAERWTGDRSPLLRRFRVVLLVVATVGWGLPARAVCTGPADLQSAVERNPTADAWAALGNWFGNQGQFDCAAEALQSAVGLDPQSARLNYMLGLAWYEEKDFAAAKGPLQRSVEADGSELNPHLLLAVVDTSLSNARDAATQWRAALDLDSGNSMARHGLSQALLKLGDYPGEIRLLNNSPLDTPLAVDLAIAYSGTAGYEEAAATLRKALESVQPDDHSGRVLVQSMLAWTLLLKGDADAALPYARQAAEEAPTQSLAQLSLGRALVDTGAAAPAIPVLEGARLLDPSDLEVHIALARAYAETGRSEEARAERQLCLTMASQRGGSALGGRKEAAPAE